MISINKISKFLINYKSLILLLLVYVLTSTPIDLLIESRNGNLITNKVNTCTYNEYFATKNINKLNFEKIKFEYEKSFLFDFECWSKIIDYEIKSNDEILLIKKIPSEIALIGGIVLILLVAILINKFLVNGLFFSRFKFYLIFSPAILFIYYFFNKNYANMVIFSMLLEHVFLRENSKPQYIYKKFLHKLPKNTSNNAYMLSIIFIGFIYQSQSLNVEVIDWDIGTFLVVSQDLLRGNIPYENQWEIKGPFLFFMYAMPQIFFSKNLIAIKIFNNLIFCLVLLSIYLLFRKINKDSEFSFYTSLIFVFYTAVSNQGHPGYSEFYVLLFLGIALNLILSEKFFSYKNYFIGFSLSFASLISPSAFIYVGYIGIIYASMVKFNFKIINKNLIGFLTPYILVLLIYSLKQKIEILLLTNFAIPFLYASEGKSPYELIHQLVLSLINNRYSILFYFFIFCFMFMFLKICNLLILQNKVEYSLIIVFGLLVLSLVGYGLSGKGYWHQTIYFVYFMSLSFAFIKIDIIKKTLVVVLILFLVQTFPKIFMNSALNIKNLVPENYPIYNLQQTIEKKYDIQTIYALNDHIILFYFDKPSNFYMVHPSLIWDESNLFMLNTLKQKGVVSINSLREILETNPDLILCDLKILHKECSDYANQNDYISIANTLNSEVFVKKHSEK